MSGGSDSAAVAYRPLGGRRVRVLAHGGPVERHLVLHGEHLYWTEPLDGTVTRISKRGGVPVVLATDQRGVGAIAIVDGWLYWGRRYLYGNEGLYRMPLGGGEPTRICEGRVEALAILEELVAWTSIGEDGRGSVHLTRVGDGRTVPLATGEKMPRSIVLDGENAYWACYGLKRPSYFEDGSIVRASRTEVGDHELLARDRSMPSSLLLDSEARVLTWCEGRTTYGPGPFVPGRIWRHELATGAARLLCEWDEQDGMLAADATHVYFLACMGGTMWRVPIAGGEPEPMLAPAANRLLWSSAIAVDDRFVYWAAHSSDSAGGAIFCMAKSA